MIEELQHWLDRHNTPEGMDRAHYDAGLALFKEYVSATVKYQQLCKYFHRTNKRKLHEGLQQYLSDYIKTQEQMVSTHQTGVPARLKVLYAKRDIKKLQLVRASVEAPGEYDDDDRANMAREIIDLQHKIDAQHAGKRYVPVKARKVTNCWEASLKVNRLRKNISVHTKQGTKHDEVIEWAQELEQLQSRMKKTVFSYEA